VFHLYCRNGEYGRSVITSHAAEPPNKEFSGNFTENIVEYLQSVVTGDGRRSPKYYMFFKCNYDWWMMVDGTV
jgi:hypothetical protein